MAEEEFDPYHKWLGIPPSEQPPNHYRLLGIELFESDLEVIESAADQRMAHLRTFQGGKNAALSQKLLNEVSKARICLLKPDSKLAYDQELGIPLPGAATSTEPPPFQISKDSNVYRKSSRLIPVAAILLLLIAGGTTFAIWKLSGTDDDTDVAQNDNDSDSGDAPKDSNPDSDDSDVSKGKGAKKSVKGELPNKKGPKKNRPKKKDRKDRDSSTEQNDPEKQNTPDKNDDADPATDKQNSDSSNEKMKMPEKSDSVDPEKNGSPTEPKKSEGEDEKKNDAGPLIIGNTSNKETATLVRAPIPPVERWKPFVSVLEKDFAINDDLTRDSRFVLFNELIKNAAEEIRPDKAYALFNIAMDQAKKLNHISGVGRYCTAFTERFEFESVAAEVAYLNAIAQDLESKPHVAKFLNQCLLKIRTYETDQKYGAASGLLKTVISLAEKPIGKDIHRDIFERWLLANSYRQKILDNLDKLKAIEKKNELTPAQQRVLGTYECFVNNNWDAGFDYYMKCDFKPIADLAKKAKEVNVADLNSIAEIADMWWVLSTKVEDEEHLFKQRCKYWYDEYSKVVNASEISKKIVKRIEDLNVGLGLKRIPAARSPTQVLFLDFENELAPGATTQPTYIEFVNSNLLAILSEEDTMAGKSTRFRVVQINSESDVYDDTNDDFIKHRIVSFAGKLAYLQSRSGIQAMDARFFAQSDQGNSSLQRRLRTREVIRAFDIGKNGEVFALADKFVYGWTPQLAWGQNGSSNRKPAKFDAPVAFIADQIRIIPNSSSIALSDHRTLVRVNLSTKSINEIHTTGKLLDYDFASNGNSVATALENGLRYKAFKGSKNLFFQTNEVTKVRFLPNSRFIVSLHKDHSLRIWDVFQKTDDYLIEKYDSHDFKPIDFSISEDGSTIAITDDTTRIKFLSLYYE